MTDLANMKYTCTERYAFGWTDYRAIYGTPVRPWWKRWFKLPRIPWRVIEDIIGRLVGTGIIVSPIAFIGWLFLR